MSYTEKKQKKIILSNMKKVKRVRSRSDFELRNSVILKPKVSVVEKTHCYAMEVHHFSFFPEAFLILGA